MVDLEQPLDGFWVEHRLVGGDTKTRPAPVALARAGVSVRGMTQDEILQRSAMGASDFPTLVSNAMNKVAAQAYQAAESPLKALARQRVLPNFKESTAIRLGEMGRLEEMTEHGEFKHTPAGFTNWFRAMVKEAKLPDSLSPHGLRKATCRRLAEAGCTANEIMAISGHKSLAEVTRYTVAASRKTLAEQAILALDKNTSATKTVKLG